ncbi:autophagy-related protein 13b [Lotus japonicus]|uniref:autophagy-related protein 13b n=1 Tax=Lotus japonicus TaxID=34305 RepID=UPI002583E615|nr:autophagy-related protein 13b [Lotus japonicus]
MVPQPHGSAHSDAAKTEQIITEFFAKSLHIILESRAVYASSRNSCADQAVLSSPCSSASSSSSSVRPRDKWFNLALRECPSVLENVDLGRRNNLECVVIDVILVQRALDCDPVTSSFSPKRVLPRSSLLKERYPLCCNAGREEFGIEAKSEKIVERWVIQYESRKTRDSNSGNRRSSNSSLSSLYKKVTLLVRSLYATVRLLPAYKIFGELNSSAQIRDFTLAHRISSIVEPLTRKEEAEMLKFGFTPVDTSSGRLCLSVMYCPSASDVSSEPSTPLFPQVIPDYVGSPLADPLRKFPSLPVAGFPFPRQHCGNCDHCRASPPSITNSAEKSFSPGKVESRKYSGVKISANSSPQISTSRSSSRSYPEDFDGSDFTWPFDLEDDDADPGSRAESLDHGHMAEVLKAGGFFPIRKSHDAAVGALVHMLKKAPPLHQDFSTSEHSSLQEGLHQTATPNSRVSVTTTPVKLANQQPKKEHSSHGSRETLNSNTLEPNQILEEPRPVSIKSTGITATRKTASDALEEFHGYKKMKNLLLKQGSMPQL